MHASSRLRMGDIQGVFRLVQECRECWADADAWHAHLLGGMSQLTGLAVGMYFEQRLSADRRSVTFLGTADRGWRDATARSRFMRLFDDHPDLVRFLPGCARLASAACDSRSDTTGTTDTTALRPQISPDRQWYASRVFNDYHRTAGIDGYVFSCAPSGRSDMQVTLFACQDAADAAPTARARAIVALLNHQLAPLTG
ncbi:MAG: hypothetical protein WBD40_02330, partial [Tepidisphaeraceae bacterium]